MKIKTKKLPFLLISDAEKDELVEIYLRAARLKLAREAEKKGGQNDQMQIHMSRYHPVYGGKAQRGNGKL